MEKKEKKGFWASLFSPKPCACSGGGASVAAGEQQVKSADITYATPRNIQEIKVLGPGCANCKSTFAVVEKVVKASGLDIRLTKVEAIEEIMRYNILATPAVVIDEKVVVKGKVPTESEMKLLLGLHE